MATTERAAGTGHTPAQMHVVLLTQYFPPEIGAPQSRLGFLARRLRMAGNRVTVVTAMPNYPTGRVLREWRGRLVMREDTDAGVVLRSWVYASPYRGTGRQMLTYASFAASAAVTAPLRVHSADLVLWESPPLSLAPVAWTFARRLRARLVMNVSDLWPRSAVDLGMLRAGSRLTTAFERLERWAYRSADLVTCQTEGIAAGVEHRAPGTRSRLFPNGVDIEAFSPRPPSPGVRRRYGAGQSEIVAGYLGNFGRAQALEQVVDAAGLLAADAPHVRVVLMGDGPRRPAIEQRLRRGSLPNVTLLDPVPHADVPAALASLDIGLVVLADRDVFRGARPSKLFELLAMGLPVAYAGRGEGAALAEAAGATVVTPERPAELAAALSGLAALAPHMRAAIGERGRAYVTGSFERAALTDELIEALHALL